ncbi:STAS-like domain-containing protein [Singulisphaera acidiphila]|uniref:DUF4325 domain-containing protein n=1 Tax=Singulisphaera acidiphila (strain ATCC BAA-1392 / DSM 18658 / VKM B-2454 / MOB10) TaxID=886293 RepID=L0D9F9_SINAD|nr:STAS-like domain-containing protein [Singulisphaera acidiphila]AGA26029.1 hypothetical protein Sinac_1651 [Singulisphaera acidiphila DSM 18658]
MPILILRDGPFDGHTVNSNSANDRLPDMLGFTRSGSCESSSGDAGTGSAAMFYQWHMVEPKEITAEAYFPPWPYHADYKSTNQTDDHGRIVFEFAPPFVVTLKLASLTAGKVPMARSEAKQLLGSVRTPVRLTLDFSDLESVGQGFADEAFRVWEKEHLDSIITYTNANPEVESMIRRTRKP